MNREQHGIGIARGVRWSSCPCVSAGILGHVLQLFASPRIAEDHIMASTRKYGTELARGRRQLWKRLDSESRADQLFVATPDLE